MSRLDIYKGLAFVLFFPFIFGCILLNSNIKMLRSIENAEPMTVKIDSLTSSHSGSSGSGDSNIAAHFSFNEKSYMLSLTGDGANYSDYIERDSIKIWFRVHKKIHVLRNVNPTKEAWRERYLNYLFVFPTGIMIYPFLIFISFFIYEKSKGRRNTKNDQE